MRNGRNKVHIRVFVLSRNRGGSPVAESRHCWTVHGNSAWRVSGEVVAVPDAALAVHEYGPVGSESVPSSSRLSELPAVPVPRPTARPIRAR